MRTVAIRRCGLAAFFIAFLLVIVAPAVATAQEMSFDGSGWGDGVGLSQYGAKAMASDGADYLQILNRYYTGILVRPLVVTGDSAFVLTDPDPMWVGLLQNQSAVSFDVTSGSSDLCFDRTGFCVARASTGTSWRFAQYGMGVCQFEEVLASGTRFPAGPSGLCDASIRSVENHTEVLFPFKARSYSKGTLRLRDATATGGIHLVLEIGVDDYLRGFSEVPDTWPEAAIEAQVVASRSLTIRKVLDLGPESAFDTARRVECNCHLLDRSPDPNYRGMAGEIAHPNWVDAVETTTGEIVSYQGSVALARFHSSSSGWTENYADVFGGDDYPYLTAVFDSPSLSDPAANPHNSWSAGFDQASLAEAFGFSWVSDMRVTQRNDSGSARTVAITGIRSGRPATDLLSAVDVRLTLSLRSTTFDVAVSPRFGDVPTDHQFAGEIVGLDALGITSGCTANGFCPDQFVTRAEMAAFLVRALDLPRTTGDPFDDDDGHALEAEIASLAAGGITSGCSTTSFCPDRVVTRAEMAAFLVRGFGLSAAAGVPFSDVGGHFFEAEIASLEASGVTSGCSTTSFCPDRVVTRAEMAAFLIRALA
jgi:SpoIID/LytB domain protein